MVEQMVEKDGSITTVGEEVEQTTPKQPTQQSEHVQQQMPQQWPKPWGANWGSSQSVPHYEMQMPHVDYAPQGVI